MASQRKRLEHIFQSRKKVTVGTLASIFAKVGILDKEVLRGDPIPTQQALSTEKTRVAQYTVLLPLGYAMMEVVENFLWKNPLERIAFSVEDSDTASTAYTEWMEFTRHDLGTALPVEGWVYEVLALYFRAPDKWDELDSSVARLGKIQWDIYSSQATQRNIYTESMSSSNNKSYHSE